MWSSSDRGTKKKPTIANDSGRAATLDSVVDQTASLHTTERPLPLPPPEAKRGHSNHLNALQGEEDQQPGRINDSATATTTTTLRSLPPDEDVAGPVSASGNNEVVALAGEGVATGPVMLSVEKDGVVSEPNLKDNSSSLERPAMESPMVSLIYLVHENESTSDIELQSSLGNSESVSSNS